MWGFRILDIIPHKVYRCLDSQNILYFVIDEKENSLISAGWDAKINTKVLKTLNQRKLLSLTLLLTKEVRRRLI